MYVTIRLAPEVAPIVQQVATEKGQDVASFLEEFVQEAFTVPRRSRTLDEILAPVVDFEASGMSETKVMVLSSKSVREKRFQEPQRHG